KPAPLMLTWRGQRWDAFGATAEKLAEPDPMALDVRRALRLGNTTDGRLWAAFAYRHQFHEYSSSGRLLTEIVVDGGDVHEVEDAEARRQQGANYQKALAEQGIRSQVMEMTARPMGIALSEGRDGRMYFLVHGDSGTAGSQVSLERFDPARAVLERMWLPIPIPGRASMASGWDGLYVAPSRAQHGLWRIPWEDLEAAEWEPVQGVEIGISDPSKLEGVWREKGGRGLVRFAKDKVITWEDGRLTVRGLVSLEGREALLRRSGFGESWKVALRSEGLRIERDGGGREYTRLSEIPKPVSLDPAPLGKVKALAPERVRTVQSELEQRTLNAQKARESKDPNQRLAVDADNIDFLRRLTAEVGWIDAGRFGVTAASQAAVLAQNSLNVLLMLAALPKVEKDLKDLPEGGPVFAAFYDALQVALGGKQRYGTQVVPDAEGDPVVLPLERRAEVDAARRKLGLPSLPEALALLSREVFDGKPVRIAEGEVVQAPPAAARQAGTRPAAPSPLAGVPGT
ncbi:MAG TPA: DUF6624 domain-containing protein, partial [Thermoanaerobaculia bacterium]|nr:DUF6624 domain-containing protein [Thermoanaerobaculia bacterium]